VAFLERILSMTLKHWNDFGSYNVENVLGGTQKYPDFKFVARTRSSCAMRRYVLRVNTILLQSAAWRQSRFTVIVVAFFFSKCLLGISAVFMMPDNKEQRVCLKFCFLLGKSAAEPVLMLQEAFKEEALSRTQVYEWYSCFRGCEMSCEDQPRSGRSSTCRNDENLDKVHNAISVVRCTTIDEISEIAGLSWSSCQRMLMEDLNMKRVSAKFVPRLLTEGQNNNHLNVCYDLREQVGNNPQILSNVVTRGETWCYGYDPETKQASSQWKIPNSLKPKKA